MDPKYGERYRELYERHWWWRARSKFILEYLRHLRPAQGWPRILDIGCGDGLFFPSLREFGYVEGVEPFSDLVNPANPDSSHVYICPFDEKFMPGKRYSLVLMLDVLEHLESPVLALRHALKLLEPNGLFLATVPAFMALWTNHDVINHHFTRYTKPRFSDVARQAGLRIIEARYLYHWTVPVKLGLRIAEKSLRIPPMPASVPANWINELLYGASRLEQKTLTRLRMPIGSSLLVLGTHDRSTT